MTPIQLDEGKAIIIQENEVEEPKSAGNLVNWMFMFNTSLNLDLGEQITFEQAMAGPKVKWQKASAISEVKRNMIVTVKEWKLVSAKVVFKIKDEENGTLLHKTWIMTLGHM